MGHSTDLTDKQWDMVRPIFETNKGGNFVKHDKRDLMNAVRTSSRPVASGETPAQRLSAILRGLVVLPPCRNIWQVGESDGRIGETNPY